MSLPVVLKQLEESAAPQEIIEAFNVLGAQEFKTFIACVDDSPYSLQEWCETVVEFNAWSKAKSRDLSLTYLLDYLYCCVQGTANEGRLLPLKMVWENYVNTYGVI